MTGAGDVDGVEVVLFDQSVHVDPDERLTWIRAPVAQEAALDVLHGKGLAQDGVGTQIDHAGRDVVAGAPVAVNSAEFGGGESRLGCCGGIERHGACFLCKA